MGASEIYSSIQQWFEKALDNYWLYYAVIVIGVLVMAFLVVSAVLLVIHARDTPQAPDPEMVFIESNALTYCNGLGFNAWEYINVTVSKQFRCFDKPNESMAIEKFLNMSN